MGHFTEGYNIGIKLSTDNNYTMDDYNKEYKNLLKKSSYNECVEWFNGFYKGMLDADLVTLKNAFSSIKEQIGNK